MCLLAYLIAILNIFPYMVKLGTKRRSGTLYRQLLNQRSGGQIERTYKGLNQAVRFECFQESDSLSLAHQLPTWRPVTLTSKVLIRNRTSVGLYFMYGLKFNPLFCFAHFARPFSLKTMAIKASIDPKNIYGKTYILALNRNLKR